MTRFSYCRNDSLALFLSIVCLYSLTFSGHLYTADGVLAYETGRSLAWKGSLEMPHSGFLTPMNTEGKPVSPYAWGQPILLVPFHWLGKGLGQLFAETPDGVEKWVLACVAFSSVLVWAFLVLAVRNLALALGTGQKGALFAALAAGCGSILWVYSQDLFRNPLAAFLLTLSVAELLRIPEKPRSVHLSGLFFMLLLQVRIDGILAAPFILLWTVRSSIEDCGLRIADYFKWVRLRLVVVWVMWCLGGLGLWGLNNWIRFGNLFQHNMPGVEFTESLLISIPGFLWSTDKSMFLYSPVLLLSLAAFPFLWRRRRAEALLIATISMVYLVWYGKFHHWFGGICWGPRYTILFTPLLVAMIGPWLSEEGGSARWRWIISWTFLAAGMLVQLPALLVEQNAHPGLHHFGAIREDILLGNLDPWWARTWGSYPWWTAAGVVLSATIGGIAAKCLIGEKEGDGND
ncbi:MAG TPA: hypothetical protein PK395_16425 [bacterium]|nr:hypothetical protein [bacterium]